MANVEEVVVKFRSEGGKEVEASFHNIAEASKAVGEHTARAGKGLDELRLKSEGRIAGNIRDIAQSLTSGGNAADIASTAFYKVAESFRGFLPLAASAGVLTTIAEQLLKARDAADEMHSSIAGLTSFSGGAAFRGIDDIGTRFDALAQKLKEVQGGNIGFAAGKGGTAFLQSLLSNPIGGFGSATAAAAREAAIEQQRQEKDRVDILKSERAEVENIAQQYRIVNQIGQERLTGDETSVKLDESKLQFLQDQEKVLTRFNVPGGSKQLGEAQDALRAIADTRDAAIKEEGREKQVGLDLTRDIIEAEKQFLPAAEQNLRILELKIAATQKLLQGNISIQQREQLQSQLAQATVDRAKQQQAVFNQGPFNFEQSGIAERFNQLHFQEARERFQQEELQRRLGAKDVRGPGLRAFEESAFGPFQIPQTEQEKREEFFRKQEEQNRRYYSDRDKQTAEFDALHPGSGLPPLPRGYNVNTGDSPLIAAAENTISAIKTLLDPMHSLLGKLDLLPSMLGVQ